MLTYQILSTHDDQEAVRRFSQALAFLAEPAGLRFDPATSGSAVDALFLVVDSAAPNEVLDAALKNLDEVLSDRAVAVVELGGTSSSTWRPRAESGFFYPSVLDFDEAVGEAEILSSWLAGFTVFAAAIKMWRRLRQGEPSAVGDRRVPGLLVNHLNILTTDLERSKDFYQRVFGATYCYNLGPNKAVLELNGFDFFIEKTATVSYPPGYHFGVRADPKGVRAIAERVEADGGITLVQGNGPAPGWHVGPDGVRTAVYFEDPDGLVIEVYSAEVEMVETNPQLALQYLESAR